MCERLAFIYAWDAGMGLGNLVAKMQVRQNKRLDFICLVTMQYAAEAYTRPLEHWVPGATKKHHKFFKEAHPIVEDYVCRGAINAEEAESRLNALFAQC